MDDANLKIKLEKHRATVSVNRTKVLEKEIEFFKDQHVRNKEKTKELEERNRSMVKEVTSTKQDIQKYKDKVKLAARPNEILKREKDRYKGDCQRLTYLLESSDHKVSHPGSHQLTSQHEESTTPPGEKPKLTHGPHFFDRFFSSLAEFCDHSGWRRSSNAPGRCTTSLCRTACTLRALRARSTRLRCRTDLRWLTWRGRTGCQARPWIS